MEAPEPIPVASDKILVNARAVGAFSVVKISFSAKVLVTLFVPDSMYLM